MVSVFPGLSSLLKFILCLTHKVGHDLAHGGTKDEVLQYAGDEGEGHAEHGHHQVADSQRQQEGVGHGPHALVDRQHHDDEQVPDHAHEEDECVEEDPQCEVPICPTQAHNKEFYCVTLSARSIDSFPSICMCNMM